MIKRIFLYLIRVYQHYLSPIFPRTCRFYPTCSQYAFISIQRFGLWIGGWYSLLRLLRCHPLCMGGYDPPPEEEFYGKETLSGNHSLNDHPHPL